MDTVFDVSQQKKKLATTKQKQTSVEEQRKVPKTTDAYPVVGMTDECMCLTNEGAPEYSYYIQVSPRDLTDISTEEYERLKKQYWNFHKSYGHALKEVYLPFKEENKKQQEYVQFKLNRATDFTIVRELQRELEKLKEVEEFYVSFRSFLVIYAPSKQELTDRLTQFLSAARTLFSPVVMERSEVASLLNKLNNMGGNSE